MANESYKITGSVLERFTGAPVAGVKVHVGSIGAGLTNKHGMFEFDASSLPSERSEITVHDEWNAMLAQLRRKVTLQPGVGAEITIHVKNSVGLQPGEVWLGNERVNLIEASRLDVVELADAYVDHINGKVIDDPAVLKSFPDLLLPRIGVSADECSAWRLPAVIQYAESRPGFDRKSSSLRALSGWPGRIPYRTSRVCVWYVPTDVTEQYDGDAVIQPGGRTLHGAIDRTSTTTPPRVQRIAIIAEDAIRWIEDLNFDVPHWSSGAPLDILVQVPATSDDYYGWTSDCGDYIVLNPGMSPAQEFSVIPHEIAHRVQIHARKVQRGDDRGLCAAIREGGARLLENCVYDWANKYVRDAQFHFDNSNVNLFGVDGNPYATGLFWKYFAEVIGSSSLDAEGIGIYRDLLGVVKRRGYTFGALRELSANYGRTLESIWEEFLVKNLRHHSTSEYAYFEEAQCPHPLAEGATGPLSGLRIALDSGSTLNFHLPPWSAIYRKMLGPRSFGIAFAQPSSGALIVSCVQFRSSGVVGVVSVAPGQGPVAVVLADNDSVILIVASLDDGVDVDGNIV